MNPAKIPIYCKQYTQNAMTKFFLNCKLLADAKLHKKDKVLYNIKFILLTLVRGSLTQEQHNRSCQQAGYL